MSPAARKSATAAIVEEYHTANPRHTFMPQPKIDTHQHLLLPELFRYPWTATFAPLEGRFGLEDYREASIDCRIQGTIFMEVDVAEEQSGAEARYFCRQAEDPATGIVGVVASGRPERGDFLHFLDSIAHPALKGIRRVLHVVPDAVSQNATFRQNLAALADRRLSFDLCVRSDQYSLCADLLDACPDTTFILDHCGAPDIAGAEIAPWRKALGELARREQLACKISGLPAYAPHARADVPTLRPWVETAIEAFGWDRIVWGGDWPVCNLNGSLANWCHALETILAGETGENRDKLFLANARRLYRL